MSLDLYSYVIIPPDIDVYKTLINKYELLTPLI